MTTPIAGARLYPANAVQMTLKMMQNGQECAVVLGGIRRDGQPFDLALGTAWRDHAWGLFRTLIVNDTSCIGATLRDVSKAGGAVFEVPAPTTNATAGVADESVIAAAGTLIKWSTATGGRSGKGRTFLPSLPRAQVTASRRGYTPAYQTQVGTAAASYISAPAGAPIPAVLSFTKGAAYPITAGSLAPVVGIQRRRMRG